MLSITKSNKKLTILETINECTNSKVVFLNTIYEKQRAYQYLLGLYTLDMMLFNGNVVKKIDELADTAYNQISYVDDKETQLDNENDRDYPNEEKLEKLESQIEVLNNAIEALEDYEAQEFYYEINTNSSQFPTGQDKR